MLALGDATLFGKVQGCLLTRAGLRQRREGNEWCLGWDEVTSARRASGWPSYRIEIGARSGETRVLECDGFSHAQRGLVRLLERVALLNGEEVSAPS